MLTALEDRSVPAAISGLAFFDTNADGIQNNNESTAPGITVTITPDGGSPVTGTTDDSGHYAFTDMAPGSYTVAFTAPSGYSIGNPVTVLVGTDNVNVGTALVDTYLIYVSAVGSAAAQYTSDAEAAYSQYTSDAAAANAAAQSQTDDAYALYHFTESTAFALYSSRNAQAFSRLQTAVSNANSAITSAISVADTELNTALSTVSAASGAAFNSATTILDDAYAAADAQYQADSQAAADAGDIDALAAAYITHVDSRAAALVAFNSANLVAKAAAEVGTNAAQGVWEASLTSAEAAWTATVQAAFDNFVATDNSAWNQYVATESTAWGQYQTALTGIAVQQQADLDVASGRFQVGLAVAADAFAGRESTAWNAYQQSLHLGQPAGPRLQTLPPSEAMTALPVLPPSPDSPTECETTAVITLDDILLLFKSDPKFRKMLRDALDAGLIIEVDLNYAHAGAYFIEQNTIRLNPNLLTSNLQGAGVLLFELLRYQNRERQIELDDLARDGLISANTYARECERLTYQLALEGRRLIIASRTFRNSAADVFSDRVGDSITFKMFLAEDIRNKHILAFLDNYRDFRREGVFVRAANMAMRALAVFQSHLGSNDIPPPHLP